MFNRKNHEPKSIDDLVIPNSKTRERLEDYANGLLSGHMIMHGPKGTGKTSAADIISKCHEAKNDNSPLEAEGFGSFEGAIMTEKDIMNLPNEWTWRMQCGMKPPTVVINELDKMSPALLEKLKATMDQHKDAGQIIATTNNLHTLPPAVADRFDKIEMPALAPGDVEQRVRGMLAAEGIKIGDAELKKILATTNGSWRDVLSVVEDIILKMKRGPNV